MHPLFCFSSEVHMVKQMPTIAANQQPTVAIISAMYYEKLAVDAMMENKTSYMRFKMEGKISQRTVMSVWPVWTRSWFL